MPAQPKISVYIATSLDGFIARPDGDIDWLTRPDYTIEGEDFGYAAFVQSVDALVMGRHSYEKVLSFDKWYYDGTLVIVLSSRPVAIPEKLAGQVESWPALSPADVIRQLNERGFRHVYLDGGKTIQAFLREGLVDEMIITRIPVLLGEGLPSFGETGRDIQLEHVQTDSFPNGFVQSRYRPVISS